MEALAKLEELLNSIIARLDALESKKPERAPRPEGEQKRGPGRPRLHPPKEVPEVKRPRGRPRKYNI